MKIYEFQLLALIEDVYKFMMFFSLGMIAFCVSALIAMRIIEILTGKDDE